MPGNPVQLANIDVCRKPHLQTASVQAYELSIEPVKSEGNLMAIGGETTSRNPQDRVARMQFCYISPSQLESLYANKTLCQVLVGCRQRKANWVNGKYHDMHSGEHYRNLCRRTVSWNGEIQLPERKYSEPETDIRPCRRTGSASASGAVSTPGHQ